jgi:hypothetical protein
MTSHAHDAAAAVVMMMIVMIIAANGFDEGCSEAL